MISDELRRWAERMSETITVEITREDAHNIRVALARSARASRKPENVDIFERLGIRWQRAVDWGINDE